MADPSYIVDGVLTDGEAWVAVASTTLGSDAASVTFTSTDDGQVGDWSQYMDLVLVTYARASDGTTNADMGISFNNDTTNANYAIQSLYGSGSSVTAWADSSTFPFSWIGSTPANTSTANAFGSGIANLYDINSGKYKTVISRSGSDQNGSGRVTLIAGTWKSQAAISEIDISLNSRTLKSGSRFDLFGVLPRMVS